MQVEARVRFISFVLAMACLFIGAFTVSVPFVKIILFLVSSVSLVVTIGPPISWFRNYFKVRSGFLQPRVDEGGLDKSKVNLFQRYAAFAKESIHLYVPDLYPELFAEEVAKALKEAAKRGVRVYILFFGEKEVFLNSPFFGMLQGFALENLIQISVNEFDMSGPAFYCFDEAFIAERHFRGKQSSWNYSSFTVYSAKCCRHLFYNYPAQRIA